GDYFQQSHVGRGAAYADYNRDGRLDLFIVNHDGPGILLENRTESGNRWIQIRLIGKKSNRSAIGATLRLETDQGIQIRKVGVQPSYLSQSTLVQHFGLGTDANIELLTIVWPSGRIEEITGLPVNGLVTITEGEGIHP
ncbi:MAG: ASPIC/UnbV domain-containing protein, partial [Bacteroidota bacterium]